MNRAQLDALLAAGLITAAQHTAAIATLSAGLVTERPAIALELPAESVAPDESARTITGRIAAYEYLIPSHGMILHTGSLHPREPLNRVKLLRDHNHADPVGYMTTFDADTLDASFEVPEGENGDRALTEAGNGLRDGMSVGFLITEYEFDDEWTLHVHAAEMYEVSLCAIPAIADAGVTSVAAALAANRKKENTTMNRAQLAAALSAGTITQEQHDAALAALEATEAALAANPAPIDANDHDAALAAGPTPQPQAQHSAARTTPRALSLRDVAQRLANVANAGDPRQFQLELANVIPSDDAGAAFIRDDWQGELFRAENDTRPWIDAFGVPQDLTNLKGKGWRWLTEPEVDEYAGDKTEVPTNEVETEDDDFTAFRIAAGHDVDRAFIDFADPDFTASFLAARMRSYKRKSNAGIRTRVLAAATAPAQGTTVSAGGVLAVTKQVIRDVRAAGGVVNRMFLADDLFEQLEDLDTERLPLWLKTATVGLNITEGSADVGTLRILNDSSLVAGTVVGFDNRAAIVREKSPIQLQAENIPHGGVDFGFFGYLRLDDHDPRVIVKRKYVEAPAG